MKSYRMFSVVNALAALGLAACQQQSSDKTASPTKVESPFKVTAGIKDIMAHEIDPAADALWESVAEIQTKAGTEHKQPRTEEEWWQARGHAITLIEAANLLVMDGRRVAMEGTHLEDHGTPGNLTAEESQKEIDTHREAFVAFAHALHDTGVAMLKAIDAKDPQTMMDVGATLDTVCEACHLKFWYPGQTIPPFPRQAPEVDAVAPAAK